MRTPVLFLLLISWLTGCSLPPSRSGIEPVSVAMPSAEASRARCVDHLAMHVPDTTPAVTAEMERFLRLSEQALTYRQAAIETAGRLFARLDAGEPLSGGDLELIHEGTRDYLAMRQQLWAVAEAHECWLTLPGAELQRHGIGADQRGEAIMISLAAALLLYDNYLLTASLYDQDTKLRRVLNQPDRGYALPRHRLTEVKISFLSPENRERVQAAVTYYREAIEPGLGQEGTAQRAYLAQLIAQSPSYAALRQNRMPASLADTVGAMQTLSLDLLARMSRDGLNLFSMVFGNTVGLVETRRGKLYRQHAVERTLAQGLAPGDILLEKTPFRLTDLMIPGYWGHAAIWVGSEPELRALGVWDHPAVRPHHHAIRQGKRIVEALRPGVTLNSLAHFLNVDDLAVLRPQQPDRDLQAARVVRAFRQIGKAYDFNFDVETTDRIVCSELVYQVYTELPWPTSRALGRATISPDQVAQRALGNGPLRVVALYRNGDVPAGDPEAHFHRMLYGGASPRRAARREM
jgi:hypothetical protein